MITTLTLNPAIDRTLVVENFTIDSVNRVKDVHIAAGGKGVNASRVVHFLGEDTTALGIAGGSTGDDLMAMLDKSGIKHDFIRAGITRINTKIVDITNDTCTDVNEPGVSIGSQTLLELKTKVYEYAQKSELLILSGNVQAGIPQTLYYDLIKELNVRVMLDASGELLKSGLTAAPWLAKPNISELSEAVGRPLRSIDEIVAECGNLNAKGIEYLCVSMGSDGLLMSHKNEVLIAKPPTLTARSTVGAGDAVVGSLAVCLSRNEPVSKALRLACAVSAASVTLPGTGMPSLELIDEVYEHVEIVQYVPCSKQ